MNDLATTDVDLMVGEDFGLSDAEIMFVYQIEVIGMPIKRAGELSGVSNPYVVAKRPNVLAARAQTAKAVQGNTDFTREDVLAGYKKAIDQAFVLGDPMAQIAGWREISKSKGYDKSINVNLHLSGTPESIKRQIKELSTEHLMELSGEKILDGDFYRLEPDNDGA